jgi:predicted TIM-barrel fold metal-dependent hydrolase
VQAAADVLYSPLITKFPEVQIALSEGGIGWIPYFLERIVTCFIDDGFGIENRHKLNLDMITWECDYPHSDSTWPLAPESLAGYLNGVPDDEIDKITHENALRLFSFDMFGKLPREQLTVGALRAQARDVDLGYRSSQRLKKTGTDTVTVLDLAAKLPTGT